MKNTTAELKTVIKEKLRGTDIELTNFFFRYGANVYVFSYQQNGTRRHTFIEAGDARYQNEMLSILEENDINPANIDRIIITHRHPDHWGLAELLARQSNARILVHKNFRSFVEGELRPEEKMWLGQRSPSGLKECNMEYLPHQDNGRVININGLGFPSLADPIELGEGGRLLILACPESTPTHSPDQIIALYSPNNFPHADEKRREQWQPTDDIVFSGDLWLMTGPIHDWGTLQMLHRLRFGFRLFKNFLLRRSAFRMDPRLQDAEAKEALKKGFHVIRVKPGHGAEFIGSSIIPNSLLANRDILLKLGYSLDASHAILRKKEVAPQVATMKEGAYTSFIQAIIFWQEQGYNSEEILAFLRRIYQEQSGGGALAAEDRKQRRAELISVLTRLKDDKAQPGELCQLAQTTLAEIKQIP